MERGIENWGAMKLHQKIFFSPTPRHHPCILFGTKMLLQKFFPAKYHYVNMNMKSEKNECEFAKWTYGGGISDILFEYV